MKNKPLLWILLFIINVNIVYAQTNDTEAALYNIGFGAVFSTIGAVINKTPDEPLGDVIKKSMWQGALGGYVTFESKRLLREAQRKHKWEYIWGAKFVNATGTSIKENAALNKDFWERWHINIGFNRIELNTKDRFSVHYKMMPVAFVYTVDAFFRYDFDFEQSLKSGEFVFYFGSSVSSNPAFATAGYIAFDKNYFNKVYGQEEFFMFKIHEIVHLYQSNDFSIFNTFISKPLERWSKSRKTLKWINKHLYPEYHYLILRPAYLIESATAESYYDNFFEHEAGFYSEGL